MEPYNPYYIDIKLNQSTELVYTVRLLLQNAIDSCLTMFSGTQVDLGCGEMPYRRYILDKNPKIKKYIGIDINFNTHHQTTIPDLLWDGKTIPLADSSIDTVMATEFFEHIGNIENVLIEIRRILKKKGILFFTVPFLWPLHETPYDEYRYTPYSLNRHLSSSGFVNIKIFPLGNYHTAMAQMICIWLYHQQLNNTTAISKIYRRLLYFAIKKLLNISKTIPSNNYGDNSMPIGFYGYAKIN